MTLNLFLMYTEYWHKSIPPPSFMELGIYSLHFSLSEEGASYTSPKVSPLPFHKILIDLSDLSMVQKLVTNEI